MLLNSFLVIFFIVLLEHLTSEFKTPRKKWGSTASQQGYVGCFQETVRRRHFSISPGSYVPERMTPSYCKQRCGASEYKFSAVAEGKFCFCSQSLPSAPPVNDNLCDKQCVGDSSQNCGSTNHVGVYEAMEPLMGLHVTLVTSDVNIVNTAPTTVTLAVSLIKGNNVAYRVDYADGAGFTTNNETGFTTRVLYLPGEYSITVAAVDEFQTIYAATGIRLEDPVKDVEVMCDQVFATYQEGKCSVTVWRGSNLQIDARVQDKSNQDIHIDNIVDAETSLVGTWASNGAPKVLDSNTVFLVHTALFPTAGKIYGWRMHISKTGPLQILVLSPDCGSVLYCLETNDCQLACKTSNQNIKTVQCSSNDPFCVQESKCSTTCTSSNNFGTSTFTVNSYKVKQIVSLDVSIDKLWYDQNNLLEVAAGDIIGLYLTTGNGGLISVVNSTLQDIAGPFTIAPAVDAVYSNVTCTNSRRRHAIQALFSAGSKTLLKYTFDGDAGEFPLNVTVVNKNLRLPAATAITTITLLEGVDYAIIEGPLYVSTGDIWNFTMAEHTGGNLTYDWDVTDGSPQTHGMILHHIFTVPGEYNITISVYNSISRKENFTTVIAMDSVNGLAVYAANSETNTVVNFSINITNGSNYTCTLIFGDASVDIVTDYTETRIPTSQQSHIYTRFGIFRVIITCQNNISKETADLDLYIEEAIVNLHLENLGAPTNTPFSIAWLVDAGSNITFSLTFDGASVPLNWTISKPDAYRWESVQLPGLTAARYPLILMASNKLSTTNVTVGFIVLESIANPTFTSDLDNVTTDDTVTFTVSMARGSDVTVIIVYQDGSLNYNFSTAGPAWLSPLTIRHNFITGCHCLVKATISNAAGSYDLTVPVLVKVGFSTISWSLPDSAYYLYEPPAFVYFNFSSSSAALPTNPTVRIDWGDGEPVVVGNSITFGSPGYFHYYDDTLDYTLTVTMSNILGSRTFVHRVIVVEKLMSPNITLEFLKAPLNQPYNVTFTLYRGDQGNMTKLLWNFEDGNSPRETEREGIDENGGDTLPVTYNTMGRKTVTVTATAPLNQIVTYNRSFEVVDPVIASALSITANTQPLGASTVFTIQYTSGNVPSDAQIHIDYGDGSISTPENFTGSRSISYRYTNDGTHLAKVIVYNDASKVEIEVPVGVYQKFINLAAVLTYRPNVLNANAGEQNGLQNAGMFPLDTPVKFTITDNNNASATVYNVKSITGPSVFDQNFATNGFLVLFPTDGNYILNITASNPLYQSTVQHSVMIVRRVYGLSVSTENDQVTPGQLKKFNFSFVDFGDDTCVYIDWGYLEARSKFGNSMNICNSANFTTANMEGSMVDLTSKPVGHRYLAEGDFIVRVIAQNRYGIEMSETPFIVSYTECSKPTVTIQDYQPLFSAAAKYARSSIIHIRGMVNINCPEDLKNTKKWHLDMVDSTTGEVITPISVTDLVTDKAELYIPALQLQQGLYKATYSVMMTEGGSFSLFHNSAHTFFQITESSLVGIMMEGSMTEITRGSAQSVQLNPLTWSLDPDVDRSFNQSLKVDSWECKVTAPSDADQTSCSNVIANAESQDIDGSSLIQNYTYNIKANLLKDTRKTTVNIFVTMNGTNPPSGVIRCFKGSVCYPQPTGYTIVESSRLSLQCECPLCTASAQYKWSVYIKDYRWFDGWRPLKDSEIQGSSPGLISKELSLEKSLFLHYKDVVDLFRIQCSINDSTGIASIATQVHIDQPPLGGKCSIQPKNVTSIPAVQRLWRIECSGWKDDNGIKEFQFYSKFDDQEVIKEITSIPTSEGNIDINVSLPIGPSYRNYEQDIYAVVRDRLNSATTILIDTVAVWPPNKEELRQFIDSVLKDKTNDFFKVFEESDQRSVSEMASAVASILTQDSLQSRQEYEDYEVPGNWICTGYGPYDFDRPTAYKSFSHERDEFKQYACDKQRNDRAKLRTELVKSALTLSYEDAVSIQQVAALLDQVTSAPTEITLECQELVIEALQTMISNLRDPLKMVNTPQEEIEKAIDYIFSTVGSVMEAAGSNGNFPMLDDMDQTRKHPLWKIYDTSIKSLGDKTDVSRTRSYEEANNLHTRNVFKILYEPQAHEIAQQTDAMIAQLVTLFSEFTIPGQVRELTSFRIKFHIEKNYIRNFLGKTIHVQNSSAEIVFPNTLKELFPDRNVSPDEVVTFQMAQSTNYPHRYTDKALQSLKGYMHFINAEFYDSNGDALPVNRTLMPIKITIPHDQNGPHIEKKLVSPLVTKWNQFQLHQTEIFAPGSSIHIKFEVVNGVQLVVVAKFNSVPDAAENNTDFIFVVPPSVPVDPALNVPYTVLLSSENVNGKVGKWWFGTREREPKYINTPPPTNMELAERYQKGSGPFTENYNVTIWVSGCYYHTTGAEDWDISGCYVSSESTEDKTVCQCNHLTTFAGGFIVAPNVIDWNFVFSNADFLSNPTIYITEIFIAVCFLIAFVLARHKDKKDLQLLGLTPLEDNDLRDKYYYEIFVSTGMRRNAGTNSKVFFIMSGENDETDVRMFSDAKRPIFKRGMINGFLMAVPECLGRINYLHVWHDNSGKGKFGSWYLNYIVVKDIQTNTKQHFIADRWLAVEEDDGQIERIIPVAGSEQIKDFSYQFSELSRKNLADDHLWFSVIARPPGSRFTCVERVACCLCLLFMTMLTNAMFYQTRDNTSTTSSTSFTFGPFAMSVSQIFIGFISTIIVFPVNFLLVLLFRKAQRRQTKISQMLLTSPSGQDRPGTARLSHVSPQIGTDSQVSLNSSLYTHNDQRKLMNDPPAVSRSVTPSSYNTLAQTEKKKKSCQLPWWCVWVAWTLLVLCTLMSATLVTFYGISFQDYTCKKWITSLIISFFTSVFITQPVKVILTAIFLSLVIKNPGGDDDNEEDDISVYSINPENELLHSNNDPSMAAIRPRRIGYKPPDGKELEKIRAQRLKEVKMWAVIREIIFYSVFIWILLIISHRNRGPDSFNYKNTMTRTFLNSLETDIKYADIKSTQDVWNWVKSGFINGIMAGSYYNNYPALRLRGYVNDKASRILGHATMRQLRIKPGKCDVPSIFKSLIPECNVLYSIMTQEDRDFDVGWKYPNVNASITRTEYQWSSSWSLNGYPYWGTLAMYSGGGYVAHLNGTKDEIKEMVTKLENETWIDRYTRAVFIEFTVYNPQVNLFSVNTLLLEFHITNGIISSYRFEPAMLLPYLTDAMIFQIVCEIMFVLFIIGFLIVEILQLIKLKTLYFLHFWSWVEIAIITLSITAIVIYFYRLIETNELTKQFKASNGNEYIKFQYVGYWNEIFAYIIGFIVFLATVKFLKLLRFNRRISMLSSTLKHSAKHLLHFSVIFWIVFLAFCQLFFLTFMNVDENYSSFIGSVISSILMMMGKFNMYYMVMAEPGLTQIIVLLYVLCVAFIILNMFVSILTDTFSEVRNNIQKQNNDYEIVDFMLNRLRSWTGIGKLATKSAESNENKDPGTHNDDGSNDKNKDSVFMSPSMEAFPSKIDKLLCSLSAIYRDNVGGGADGYKLSPFTKMPYQAPPRMNTSEVAGTIKKKDKRRASMARVDM